AVGAEFLRHSSLDKWCRISAALDGARRCIISAALVWTSGCRINFCGTGLDKWCRISAALDGARRCRISAALVWTSGAEFLRHWSIIKWVQKLCGT
ncbi:hypothetical protein OS493_025523, partial [Desmophyllum pertusum]